MNTSYINNQYFFLKILFSQDFFAKFLLEPIMDLIILKKRRSGFKKRLSTP